MSKGILRLPAGRRPMAITGLAHFYQGGRDTDCVVVENFTLKKGVQRRVCNIGCQGLGGYVDKIGGG